MGGVDCLDQNIAMYMIAYRSKKWWVVVNLPFLCRSLCKWCISNLYKNKRTQGKSNLTSLDSDRVLLTHIIDVTERTQRAMFSGSRKKTKYSDEVRFNKLSHWIGKAKQWCAKCEKTTLYFCEKSNVALHPECFKGFHKQWQIYIMTSKKKYFLSAPHSVTILMISWQFFICCL